MDNNYINQRQPPFFGGFRGPFQPGFPPSRGPGMGQPGFPPGRRPDMDQPGFFPGIGPGTGRPGFPPSPGFGQNQRPTGPPPAVTPRRPTEGRQPGQPGLFFVDPGAIRPCLFQFVYIWLADGRQFWAWLTFVGPNSVAGWRWTGFNWVFFGTDLRNIDTFVCF